MQFLLPLLKLLLYTSSLQLVASSSYQAISKPGCQDQCGNVKIPYPFGIGPKCSYSAFFEIICDTSLHPPKPFLRKFSVEVMDISWKGKNPRISHGMLENDQVIVLGTPLHNMCKSNSSITSIDFGESPYRFFSWFNVLVVKGCGGKVVLKDRNGSTLLSCATLCFNDTTITSMNKDCLGIGCCQVSFVNNRDGGYQFIRQPFPFYQLNLIREASEHKSSNCNMRAGLIDSRSVNKFVKNTVVVPTLLEWSANPNAEFNCPFGYEGNPFLSQGCKVLRECRKCRNSCTSETDRQGQVRFHCLPSGNLTILDIIISIIGSVSIVMVVCGLYALVKKIKAGIQKGKNFRRNGGLLLLQHISSRDNIVQNPKIFTIDELEKATNRFSEDRILGKGGQGRVYKGMLEDGTIVAIKKSLSIIESQVKQFINEIRILSQINHRNVVKLLGCCFETEVPLLVCEFISNGTLKQHIHQPSEDFHITWRMRLRIASESASALAYLHSSSASRIYHRDIKTDNILLDDNYNAKVSDFGISRTIPNEQSYVSTNPHGTFGYFDPEYFQSQQYTDKSDVYSFGVVLLELITGKEAVFNDRSEEKNLANEYMIHKRNSWLRNNVDPLIKGFVNEEELLAVANLAKECLSESGKQRPTMRTVAAALDSIWSANVSTPKL